MIFEGNCFQQSPVLTKRSLCPDIFRTPESRRIKPMGNHDFGCNETSDLSFSLYKCCVIYGFACLVWKRAQPEFYDISDSFGDHNSLRMKIDRLVSRLLVQLLFRLKSDGYNMVFVDFLKVKTERSVGCKGILRVNARNCEKTTVNSTNWN